MIVFEKIEQKGDWHGTDWTVTSDEDLANLIAKVAVGQYRHVQKVLDGTKCVPVTPTLNQIEGAIGLLTADDPEKPWHRDGWVFQVISWIAACLQDPKALKSPPQMIQAHKGFDGLHLRLDDQQEKVEFVVVCEEKATTSPRNKITSEVWPEFRSLEAGKKDYALVSEITSVLSQNTGIDPDEAIQELLWKEARAYRVSITVGEKENSKEGRKALFKGYESVAPGHSVDKRRAETFFQEDLREWLSKIAAMAVAAAEGMA